MTITTSPFGLRELALDALNRSRELLARQQAEMTQQRRRMLVSDLRLRMLRLFNIDGVPLTPQEETYFTPAWFSMELLDPGVTGTETLFAHVNGFVPVCVIEGVMLAPSYSHLVVGTWIDGESPTDLQPINGLQDLGYWCENRQQELEIDRVPTENDDVL